MQKVTVYGMTWCVSTWDVRRLLETIEVPFDFVDLDENLELRAWAEELGKGTIAGVLPIVRLSDGSLVTGATRQSIARVYNVRLDTGLLKRMARDQGVPTVSTD